MPAKKKTEAKLCAWCNKNPVIEGDPDYNICQKCLDRRDKEPGSHLVYHLPGNP